MTPDTKATPGEEVRAVERYNLKVTSPLVGGLQAEPGGAWVHYSDYESLRARAESLATNLDFARGQLAETESIAREQRARAEREAENAAGLRETIEGLRRLVRDARTARESAERERDAYSARIEELQAALHRWLPSVPANDHPWAEQIGDDACLLIGLELDVPEWGAQVWRERDALVKALQKCTCTGPDLCDIIDGMGLSTASTQEAT